MLRFLFFAWTFDTFSLLIALLQMRSFYVNPVPSILIYVETQGKTNGDTCSVLHACNRKLVPGYVSPGAIEPVLTGRKSCCKNLEECLPSTL